MSENSPSIFESGQFTVRMSDETHRTLKQFYRDIAGFEPDEQHPPLSAKALFDKVLALAITGLNGNKENSDKYAELERTYHTAQNGNIQLEAENRILQQQLNDANEEIETLQNATPGGENGLLLILNPAIADLVDQCVNRASIKTGRKFTRVDIFMNLFWEAVSTGRASLPIIFSSSEVSNIIQKHKE